MKISFVDRSDLLTESNREHAERTLLYAFSRFSNRIDEVRITVKDTNGPKGGVDIECLGQVFASGFDTIEVKQMSANFGVGMSHLARRMCRVFARKIAARRGFSRMSVRKTEWPDEEPAR